MYSSQRQQTAANWINSSSKSPSPCNARPISPNSSTNTANISPLLIRVVIVFISSSCSFLILKIGCKRSCLSLSAFMRLYISSLLMALSFPSTCIKGFALGISVIIQGLFYDWLNFRPVTRKIYKSISLFKCSIKSSGFPSNVL